MRELDNAYRILELEPGASMEEVNQAYKDLVFVWHPDRIPQDNDRLYQKAQDKIKALNQARDLLRSQGHNGPGSTSATPNRSGASSRASAGGDRYYRNSDYRSAYSTGYSSNSYGTNGSGSNGHSSYSYNNGNGRSHEAASGYGATADSSGTPPSSSQNRYYRYQRSTGGSYYGQPRSESGASGARDSRNGGNHNQTTANHGSASSNPSSSTSGSTANGSTANGSAASNGGATANGSAQTSSPYQTYRQRRDAAAGVGGTKTPGASPGSHNGSGSYTAPGTYDPAKSREREPEQGYNTYNAHTRNAASSAHRARQSRDLSGTDLSGANLREKDFSNRNLSEANLSGADLSDAFLHKVNLNRANLSKAKLFRANLLQADLSHANLREADLIGADFSGADLSGADLSGAKVAVGGRTMVKLTGTILTGAIMPDGSIHD